MTAVLAEMTNCVPAPTPLVPKWYRTRPAGVVFRMGSGDTSAIDWFRGVQGDPMGAIMFWLALQPELKCFRDQFEGERVENFVYMDGVSLGLTGVTANTV